MRLKRWISGLCAAVLCLGCVGSVCALTPPNPQPVKYEITQPSGETFFVYGGESWTPPFDVGTIITATPKENDNTKYIVYLNEDGYWYYLKYSEVTYVASNDPDSNIMVRTEEEFWEKIGGSNHYIWDRVEPTIVLNTKFMIDPLPDKVLRGHTYLDMRETSQEEKDAMAAAIEAERERLGKNVTSVISDPGPEMFIYEPVETEAAGEPIAAETEQPQTSAAAETIGGTSDPSQSTEPTADTSAAAPALTELSENTRGGIIWIILLCSGGVIVIAGVVLILLLQRKKMGQG